MTPGPACPVVTAGLADLDALSQVIADAFHDLAPSQWLITDPETRRAIFPGYFRIYAEHALTAGVIHTTPDRAAAALWLPAGPGTPGEPPGYPARLAAATAPWTGRFVAFDAALEARHPAGFAHHHLALLAVRPGRQGQGTGTALLRAYHQILDRDNMPAYLEASGPRTRRIYLHHGYTDHGPPIHLPDGPRMYPMWREPRPLAQQQNARPGTSQRPALSQRTARVGQPPRPAGQLPGLRRTGIHLATTKGSRRPGAAQLPGRGSPDPHAAREVISHAV